MQYQKLLPLIPFLMLVSQSPGLAQENLTQSGDDFWRQSEDLVQSQVSLIDRLTVVLTTASAEQLDQAQLQLLRNDIRVNDFLTAENRNPQTICQSTGDLNNTFSPQQQQIYCTLFTSQQKLLALMPVLNRRLGLLQLSGNPLLRGGIPMSDPRLNTATFFTPDNGVRLPEFNTSISTIVGSPAKPAIADFRAPLLPAIAPAAEIQQITNSVRQALIATARAFPPDIIFTADLPNNARREEEDLLAKDLSRYQALLEQPNTGITRILPSALRPQPRNQIQSRLQPTVAQEFPFTSVLTVNNNPVTARLALEIDRNGNLQIAQPGLDYGFIANLGDVELDQVTRAQPNLTSLTSRPDYRFFFSYAPPSRLEALQVDRRRFLTGKLDNFAPDGLRSIAIPLLVNQTYLVRLVQFQLPASLVNREVIPRRDRRYLDQLLQTSSSDILVAFRPIARNNDGSYTMIWRLVNQFPDPQVLDLATYLDLE